MKSGRKEILDNEGSTSNAFIVNLMTHLTHPKNNLLYGVTRDCVEFSKEK